MDSKAVLQSELYGFLSDAADSDANILCAIGLHDDERWISQRQLRRGIGVVVGLLADRNLMPGDRVAVIGENSPEHLMACLGILWAGMVAVPISHRLPATTIRQLLADVSCTCMMADRPRYDELVSAGVSLPALAIEADGFGGGPEFGTDGLCNAVRAPEDEAFILFTSGSSGLPKGVPLTHSGFAWAISKYEALRPLVGGGTAVIAAPLFHMNALFSALLMLRLGSRVAFLPRFEASSYLRAVARHRCVILTGIPTMIVLMAKETTLLPHCDLTSVRMLLTGSAPLSERTLATAKKLFPCAQIVNAWGTTESGPACFGAHPHGLPRPALSLGYPIDEVEVRLVGGQSPSEGVLHVRTPAVMKGYVNRPEETAAKLKDGWYDTGDIMRRDVDGFYYFVGRADDMFVCAGENIYSSEVERRIEAHPAVAQAAVVPIADDTKGAIPVAFVVPKPDASLSEDEIKTFTLNSGPAHAHPRRVFVFSELPLAGTNKVDRKLLVEMATAEMLKREQGAKK